MNEFDRLPSILRPQIERVEGGCWEWRGYVTPSGYGSLKLHNSNHRVHRLVYEATRGAIPNDLVLDHLCRNKICVNPEHLEPVTILENSVRGIPNPCLVNKAKTHCPVGHPFDDENTHWSQDKKTGVRRRYCRQCWRDRGLEKRKQRDAALLAKWSTDNEATKAAGSGFGSLPLVELECGHPASEQQAYRALQFPDADVFCFICAKYRERAS
jgi:hypothetical protein